MSKQKEIRGGMEFIAEKGFGLDWNSSVYLVDFMLEYQHSQGVLVVVEREQKYSERTGAPIEPIKYKILETLIEEGQ